MEDDLSKKVEWQDFSLEETNDFEVMKVYKKVIIIDLNGKRFEFKGRFCVNPQEDRVVATALP
jgi:tartrate dehydratase beta subunit/fumarate hydratase class I family protein